MRLQQMKLFQELRSMQQTFISIKIWNYLQPGKEIGWLNITQDFVKGFPLKKNQHIQCYNRRG